MGNLTHGMVNIAKSHALKGKQGWNPGILALNHLWLLQHCLVLMYGVSLSSSVVMLKVSAFFLILEKVVLSRTYPLSSSGGVYC